MTDTFRQYAELLFQSGISRNDRKLQSLREMTEKEVQSFCVMNETVFLLVKMEVMWANLLFFHLPSEIF